MALLRSILRWQAQSIERKRHIDSNGLISAQDKNAAMTSEIPNGLVAGTRTLLHAPRTALCSCIRAYIARSTMDVPLMSESQRHNHYPSASICTITWYLQGQGQQVRLGDKEVDIPFPGRVVLRGPQTVPSVSYNPGKVDMFMLVLLPEALHALTGVDIAAHTDCSAAFDQVFDTEWQAMAREVMEAPDHSRRIALIEAFFEPRWLAARSRNGLRANWLQDYMQGMAVRIIASEWTRSVRQLERWAKTWSGLSLQRLRKMRKAEHHFLATRDAIGSGTASWADVAADSGYADQAHFCRETRKATGLAPKEFKHRVMHEESYWVYRIWS